MVVRWTAPTAHLLMSLKRQRSQLTSNVLHGRGIMPTSTNSTYSKGHDKFPS